MYRIARFFRELRSPALKCKRVGHRDATVSRKIRRSVTGYNVVVEDYRATFTVCSRCGREEGPQDEKQIDWFSSCSMPDYMWDDIREKGYVEL